MLVSFGFIFPDVIDSPSAFAVSREPGLGVETSMPQLDKRVTVTGVVLGSPWSGETEDHVFCLALLGPSSGKAVVWEI